MGFLSFRNPARVIPVPAMLSHVNASFPAKDVASVAAPSSPRGFTVDARAMSHGPLTGNAHQCTSTAHLIGLVWLGRTHVSTSLQELRAPWLKHRCDCLRRPNTHSGGDGIAPRTSNGLAHVRDISRPEKRVHFRFFRSAVAIWSTPASPPWLPAHHNCVTTRPSRERSALQPTHVRRPAF